MAQFCLTPQFAEQFKKDILAGRIDPEALGAMTSAERHAAFAKTMGEGNAAGVNALFESKLLLKNQQAGMVSWAKKVMGENTPAGRDAIAKIRRLDRVLTARDEDAFLEDLAAQKLGTHVTFEEAQKITELSHKVEEAKTAMAAGGDRMTYGRAVIELKNYVNGLKQEAGKFSLSELKSNPGGSIAKGVTELAGNAKALKASMDNSAIFRQGWKAMWTHPQIWAKNSLQSFADLVKTFGKDGVMDELNADIVSRPTYDLMKRAKLDVGVNEEAFPTALPERIPVLGKIYKASENAFGAFVRRTRADIFDKYIQVARNSGVELNDRQLVSIGRLANTLTGRGYLGKLEPAAGVINNVFFSPRMLKSNIDILTAHSFDRDFTPFARKQAAINLLKIIVGTGAILAIAKSLFPESVEEDPRSSDFGKIRVGNTRFEVTGGLDSLITLASRLATLSSKSSTSGAVNPLNAKDKSGNPAFGAQTGTDVVYNFFENKLSPAASVLKDLAKGQTFEGDKPTIANESSNLFVPLPVTTFEELRKTPGSANIILGMIADGLGINTNSYAPKPSKAKSSSSKFKY